MTAPWLRLYNDGDKAVVVIRGDPYPREVCFVDGKYLTFDDKLKSQGHKPALRIAFNVSLLDSKEAKVFECGVTFFKDVLRMRERFGLDKWAFEIQRHGAAKDKRTTYSILPDHELTAEQQRDFKTLPLLDIASIYGDRQSDDEVLP